MLPQLRLGLFLTSMTVLLTACSRHQPAPDAALPLSVDVRADTSRAQVLEVGAPPEARIWVARVAPVRASPPEPEMPEAPQDSVVPASPPPLLEIDDDLKPPILERHAILSVPASYGRRRAVESVELD